MSKAKAIGNDIVENINTQRILFRILVIGLIMLGVAYASLIGSITFNIVARKSLENTMIGLSSNVNQLELSYLNMVNKIDKDYALDQGFVDIHQNLFASRSINHVAIR